MEAKEKLFMALKDNEALMEKLEEAWKENASEELIQELLVDEGIQLDEDALQELLAMRQQKALDDITASELDEEQLKTVAGGGDGKCDGTSNCDSNFNEYSFVPKGERCTFKYLCDQFANHECPNDWMTMTSRGCIKMDNVGEKKCTNYA